MCIQDILVHYNVCFMMYINDLGRDTVWQKRRVGFGGSLLK